MAMWNPLVVIIMQSLEDTMCPPTENFSHHKKRKKKCLIQVKIFFEVTTRPYSSFTKPENLRAARFREAVVVEGRRVALSVYRCLKQQKEDFGGMSKLLKHDCWPCDGVVAFSSPPSPWKEGSTSRSHSSSVQAATTVDEHSLASCVWTHFPDGFPRYGFV